MASLRFPLLFFFLLLIILSSSKPTYSIPISTTIQSPTLGPRSTDFNTVSSIHDVLKSHSLPIGLFPKSISEFAFDQVSGRFELHVTDSPCDAKFETQVRYEWNVSGTISYGRIQEISGLSAQELFLWLPVKGIQVDIPSSGLIYFDVGVVSKQFSLSFFETPRDCSAATAEEGGGNRRNELSQPIDLSFMKGRGRIIQKSFERSSKEHHEGHELKAVS
ncbi:uncharacterized protein [Coffea arabica]|uniref:Uncharacterized protein n=1 Tax=Coffea arabica TaxID=13443 RepID=A0A6P6UB43_COFAR